MAKREWLANIGKGKGMVFYIVYRIQIEEVSAPIIKQSFGRWKNELYSKIEELDRVKVEGIYFPSNFTTWLDISVSPKYKLEEVYNYVKSSLYIILMKYYEQHRPSTEKIKWSIVNQITNEPCDKFTLFRLIFSTKNQAHAISTSECATHVQNSFINRAERHNFQILKLSIFTNGVDMVVAIPKSSSPSDIIGEIKTISQEVRNSIDTSVLPKEGEDSYKIWQRGYEIYILGSGVTRTSSHYDLKNIMLETSYQQINETMSIPVDKGILEVYQKYLHRISVVTDFKSIIHKGDAYECEAHDLIKDNIWLMGHSLISEIYQENGAISQLFYKKHPEFIVSKGKTDTGMIPDLVIFDGGYTSRSREIHIIEFKRPSDKNVNTKDAVSQLRGYLGEIKEMYAQVYEDIPATVFKGTLIVYKKDSDIRWALEDSKNIIGLSYQEILEHGERLIENFY
ncbi:MAG: transposase [Methanobacteriota archaeon]